MKTPKPYIKTLDRLKVSNLSGRLIREIDRIMPPDAAVFHEAIVSAGAPQAGQFLRYLPFNRQVRVDGDATTAVSLVVLFNNPCMDRFLLKGLHERVSRVVFKFSRNVMDGFIRAVRVDRRLLQIMGSASGAFSVMGIVQRDAIEHHRFLRRRVRTIAPLLLIPGVDAAGREYVAEFEKRRTIGKIKIPLLPIYRKAVQAIAD